MKRMKKLVALLVTTLMVLTMGSFAFAAGETYTITIENPVGTYEAYQIFSGDLSESTLSNVKWGTGVTEAGQAALGNAAAKAKALENGDAHAFAKELADSKYLGDTSGTYANGAITGLSAGYYLVKNTAGSVEADTNNVYTDYIVEVVKDVTVQTKGTTPTVTKKVDDKNDSDTSEDAVEWKDSADYDIGDVVPFQLTGNLPTNYANYETYKYVFHDTLCAGLTYQNDVKVYKNEVSEANEITGAFTVDTQDISLDISCDDLKGAELTKTLTAADTIIVTYTAKLNDDANTGLSGNPNEVYLEYSNNPTQSGDGTPTTGKTPTDKVVVFTYKVTADKVDQDGKALPGAGFTLYKYNAASTATDKYEAVGEEITGVTKFEWKGIDDGQYKLVETTTPAGYNTIPDQYFTVTATHTDGDNPALTALNGVAAEGSVIELTANKDTGNLATTVENKKGSVLPTTGGMGTTLFYIFGSILVLGAGVLLFTRKRMAR